MGNDVLRLCHYAFCRHRLYTLSVQEQPVQRNDVRQANVDRFGNSSYHISHGEETETEEVIMSHYEDEMEKQSAYGEEAVERPVRKRV